MMQKENLDVYVDDDNNDDVYRSESLIYKILPCGNCNVKGV